MFKRSSQHSERLVVEVPTRQTTRIFLILTLILPPLIIAAHIGIYLTPREGRIGLVVQNPFWFLIYFHLVLLGTFWLQFYRERQNNFDQRRQDAAAASQANRNEPSTETITLQDYPHIRIDRKNPSGPILTCILLLVFIGLAAYTFYTWFEQIPVVVSHGYFSGWSVFNMCLDCVYFSEVAIVLAIFSTRYQQQIIATANGLISQQGGDVKYIPWHEARLYAMLGTRKASNGKPLPPVFELASLNQSIRWTIGRQQIVVDTITPHIRPVGKRQPYDEALIKQFETLHTIVASHTGLPLQDLRT